MLLAVGLLMVLSRIGPLGTGWYNDNDERREMGTAGLTSGQYFRSGHFPETPFGNGETGFLQMALCVLLTVWLRQKGSSESKKLYEDEDVAAATAKTGR